MELLRQGGGRGDERMRGVVVELNGTVGDGGEDDKVEVGLHGAVGVVDVDDEKVAGLSGAGGGVCTSSSLVSGQIWEVEEGSWAASPGR